MIVQKIAPQRVLSEAEIRNTAAEALAKRGLSGKRVLVLTPDLTRTAPMPMIFRVLFDVLGREVAQLDYLIALGTHPPMTDEQIDKLYGLTPADRAGRYKKVRMFNHLWKDDSRLRHIGTISEEDVARETHGLMREAVPVMLNKLIFDYDHLLIVSPVFPHEVVGFSGGHKYLFPGIAAPDIINFTHWLGAVITNPVINGTKDTPVRRVIERAASFVDIPRTCMAFVAEGADMAGLFIGDVYEAWSAAADLSAKTHVKYVDRPFKKVLSCAPEMYDDIWTAGKCMYKLEPALADGAELVIFAPHITEISYSHAKTLDKIGYHVRDYFRTRMDQFKGIPRGLMAHSTHVKGIGTFLDGVEKPRVNVSLATGIPKERCKRVNLGYIDPKSIKLDDWQGRESEGVHCIPRAGEVLFRLADGSVPRIPGDV